MNTIKTAFSVVIWRWFTATAMLWNHRRTLVYMAKQGWWKKLRRFIFVTYFVRGEDCGKGVLDWVWKLTGWAPFLWDIEVEVTTRCYLRCIHCEHTYFPKGYLNKDLSFGDFKVLLDGIPNLKWINLTGEGCAFLNKDFGKMLWECHRRGIYVDFSHEFHQITDEQINDIILSGVERVYWSIDATTPQTYADIRVGASLNETIYNVKRLLERKKQLNSPLPEVCVRFAFFQHNIDELAHLVEFLDAIRPAEDWGDEPALNVVALLEFEQTKDWIVEAPEHTVAAVNEQARRYGWKVYWSHITHDENAKPPLEWCTFWSEPYVMITGHVVPCCGVLMSNKRVFLEIHAFGNIHDQSLRDIWRSEYYKEFRQKVTMGTEQVPIICDGCRVFNTRKRRTNEGIWVVKT